MEIWKDVENYENKYEVSNLGIVRNKKSKKTLGFKNGFYFYVELCNNNQCKQFIVHRLVAKAFVLNLESKLCVNHKNGNKLDNRAENLEWVTQMENVTHSIKTGLTKTPPHYYHKLMKNKTYIICNQKVIEVFDSIEDLKNYKQYTERCV